MSTKKVLMCTPEYFDIVDVKNYFMQGGLGSVDRKNALSQWSAAKEQLIALGLEVHTIKGAPDVEDMSFAANAGLCWERDGKKIFLASNMKHASRQRETPYYVRWFEHRGYIIERLAANYIFEGNGDAIWNPGKKILWGGYGHRTIREAYDEISRRFGINVIPMRLASEEFYHLDTCLCLLDEVTAMYCPEAFDAEGNAKLEQYFSRRITFSKDQGKRYFTGNAFAIGDGRVVLQRGDKKTMIKLKNFGFTPIEVNLDEYMKSGGNMSCIKLNLV